MSPDARECSGQRGPSRGQECGGKAVRGIAGTQTNGTARHGTACVPGSGRVRGSFGKAGGTPAPRCRTAGRGARRMQTDQTDGQDAEDSPADRAARPVRRAVFSIFRFAGTADPARAFQERPEQGSGEPVHIVGFPEKLTFFPKSAENRAGPTVNRRVLYTTKPMIPPTYGGGRRRTAPVSA